MSTVFAKEPLVTRRGVRSLSLEECRLLIASTAEQDLPDLLRSLSGDPRRGVRDAVRTARGRLAALRAEAERLESLASLEDDLRMEGFAAIAGLDEVGRGALAGPVSAGAIVLPPGLRIDGLDDSKRLAPERREELAVVIKERCVAWGVGHVSSSEIDSHGMTWAVREAMLRALTAMGHPVDHVVVDGLGAGLGLPETAVVDGDAKVAAIAAASIVAKVTRDALMVALAEEHPRYLFHENKGYGTPEHLHAISAFGLCASHRRSFAPCGGTIPLF